MTTARPPLRLGFFTRATPIAFGAAHVERLRRAGLDDFAIADVIRAASFFNGANRLMPPPGEPTVPAKR